MAFKPNHYNNLVHSTIIAVPVQYRNYTCDICIHKFPNLCRIHVTSAGQMVYVAKTVHVDTLWLFHLHSLSNQGINR